MSSDLLPSPDIPFRPVLLDLSPHFHVCTCVWHLVVEALLGTRHPSRISRRPSRRPLSNRLQIDEARSDDWMLC